MTANPIKYLRRGEIDTARWDHCIDTAPNGLIYAYSFYLDHMARNWDALVLNDYEAVMPLTWNKKFGICYLYQPAFTANLGVFGKSVTGDLVQQMIDTIPQKKFRLIEIDLNHGNTDFPLLRRVNQILDLNKPYHVINAGYNENLQRNLKKAHGQQLRYATKVPVEDIIQLARQHPKNQQAYKENDYINFSRLFSFLHRRSQALACGVYNTNNELTASAVFFFSHRRAYYILVGNRTDKRTEGASHFLIDRFIHDHAGKSLWLDFEGSDVETVANFYRSFGSSLEKYPMLRINRLPWLLKLLKL